MEGSPTSLKLAQNLASAIELASEKEMLAPALVQRKKAFHPTGSWGRRETCVLSWRHQPGVEFLSRWAVREEGGNRSCFKYLDF